MIDISLYIVEKLKLDNFTKVHNTDRTKFLMDICNKLNFIMIRESGFSTREFNIKKYDNTSNKKMVSYADCGVIAIEFTKLGLRKLSEMNDSYNFLQNVIESINKKFESEKQKIKVKLDNLDNPTAIYLIV